MKAAEALILLTNRCADPLQWHHGGGIGSPGKPHAQCVLGHLGDILGMPRHGDARDTERLIDYTHLDWTDEVVVLWMTRPLPEKRNGPFRTRADSVAANNDAVSHPELMQWLYRAQRFAKELEP